MKDVCVKGCSIGTGIPKICVPIVARNIDELFSQARAMNNKDFDIVEWRVDWFKDILKPDCIRRASRILRGILDHKPILFTFRTPREGGKIEIDMEYYKKINMMAIEERLADMIDIELFCGDAIITDIVSAAHKKGVPVVISNHDFEKTPPRAELVSRLHKAEELGGDILKIAVMPQNIQDVLELLGATEQMSRESELPLITMSMGSKGLISRLSGEVFGSAVTFGTIGLASAPGQIEIDALHYVLELLHKNQPK
ncbi:MAG: type I 3-dehydroquinate dehydratase [Eubacteriales bacterium]|nr:type I 3-dehydroquinate dehydratase [Eubacteriales bacterium]